MGKIIGEQLQDYVINQIQARQDAHGSGTGGSSRSLDQLSYLNSKTAWVKLASGVTISGERIGDEEIRGGLSGTTLAKRYVLFSGTSNAYSTPGQLIPRGTVGTNNYNNIWGLQNGTYNVNASTKPGSTFGLVPMPGITSADIKCLNRGSTKKATVSIKCYSPEQFQIIDLLYLRLGYTVFLEWGNSLYIDGDKIQNVGYTLTEDASSDGFFSDTWKDSSYLGFLPVIEKKRKKEKGNYDGLLCKVVNFSWTFSQDGSYDVTLELLSLGDVIESLKINIAPSIKIKDFITAAYALYKEEDTADEDQFIPPSQASNWISAYLFLQKIYLDQENVGFTGYDKNARRDRRDVFIRDALDVYEVGGVFITPPAFPITVDGNTFTPPKTEQTNTDVCYFNYSTGEGDSALINDSGFYMRFGHLLQFISEYVIPIIDQTAGPDGKEVPMIKIDYNQWANRMYVFSYQVSLDPRVCIVNGKPEPVNTKEFYYQLDQWKNLSNPNEPYAWTMNIYLNHDQIQSSLDSNMNDKGDIDLFGFLNSLCIALNKALGGINNLEPIYDEDSHTIFIVDASYQPPVTPKYALQLYGYKGSESTFVRNFNLKTEITNDFANMATIGSTAGGYVKGVENTMFSKWNKGIKDRFKEKFVPPKKSRDEGSTENEARDLYVKEFWNKKWSAAGMTLKDVEGTTTEQVIFSYFSSDEWLGLSDEIIENNLEIVSDWYKYCQSKIQEDKNGKYSSPTNGFVPINLSITMDGISGIKIYNEINVDTRFLPKNYPDNLRFIVKGVNHKLSNSDWETNIETVTISRSE